MDTPDSSARYTPGHGHARHERTILPERNLDMLRAGAVVLLILRQFLITADNAREFANWSGAAGIAAFIVHTTVVLMGSLERDGAATRPGWVGRFYLRRVWRIYPLAWLVIAIVVIAHVPSTLHGTWSIVSPVQLAANLLLVQDLSLKEPVLPALGTLPFALQISLLVPLFFVLARRRSWTPMIVSLAICCAISALWTYGVQPMHVIAGMKRLPLFQLLAGVPMGVMAYHFLYSRERVAIRAGLAPTLSLVLLAAAGTFLYYDNGWLARAVFCASLAAPFVMFDDAPASALTTFANGVAKLAYAAYALHQLAIHFAFEIFADQDATVKLLIAIVSLVIASVLAHRYIEKPGIALGRKLLGLRHSSARTK